MNLKTIIAQSLIGVAAISAAVYTCTSNTEKPVSDKLEIPKKEIPFDSTYSNRFSFWQKEFALPIDTIVENYFGVYGLSKNKSPSEYNVLQYIPYIDIQDSDKIKGMILLKNCSESHADSLRRIYNSSLIEKVDSTVFRINLEMAIEGSKQFPAKK
jgi:hypothetical protein